MTATGTPASVSASIETIPWAIDLCFAREAPTGLPGAYVGLHLNGGLALVQQGQVRFASTDWSALGAALRGQHPLDRIRALLLDTGSLRWRRFAEEYLIPTRALEELASRWPHYGAITEAALLAAARDQARQSEEKAWWLLSDRSQQTLARLAELFELGPQARLPALTGLIAAAVPAALERRLAFAPPGQPLAIELCLPFLCRREWSARDEALAGMLVETGVDGRVWVRKADEEASTARNRFHCFAAGAGPWLPALPHPRPAGFSLTFEDTREFAPDRVRPEYLEMLAGYGLEETARAAFTRFDAGAPLHATLHLRLAGESVLRWTQMPAEREGTYCEAFRPAALALQMASRRWAPVSWFQNLENSTELFQMRARLAFAATPISRVHSRGSFAYEVLDEDSRRRALDGARLGLPAWLDRARQRMLAAGHIMRAKNYAPRAIHKILPMLLRNRRTYDGYLLADAQNIDQFALLAAAGRSLRQAALREPARAVRRLGEFMLDFSASMARRTRRLFPHGDLAEYPSLLLIEATHAIAPEFAIEATLILRQNGREVVLRNS